MSIIQSALYFRNTRPSYSVLKEDPDTGLTTTTGIVFDLLLSETHARSANVTDRPLENGATISDHIRNSLEQGSISGMVTNFSIYSRGLSSNRAQDAFDALEKLWKDKVLVTLVTVLKVYENVAITSFSVDRDEGTGEQTTASITFRKVNKVKLKTIQIEASISPGSLNTDTAKQASPKKDLGQQVGS